MRLETRVIKTSDGIELFVRDYSPEQSDPTRTVYWVHGLGEHGGRIGHVAEVLTQWGWRMIIADLRGHGLSTGTRTHVKSFDEYSDDIALIWDQFGLNNGATVLLGHSMGGLIAIRTVQTRRVVPSSLVLSSPLLGIKIPVNPLIVLAGSILVKFIPTFRFSNRVDPANMTHDSHFVALRRADKLITKTVTASWFFAMSAALVAAQRDAAEITVPLLALQGSLDQTTDPEAMESWWSRVLSADRGLIVLEGHFHELFFEPDWHGTTDKMLEWLEQQNRNRISEMIMYFNVKERR